MLFLFLIVGSGEYDDEVSACVEAIAESYLRSKCLAFLFPLNFSDPSVVAVRSGLLKSIRGKWTPFLPAINP